MRWLLLPLLLVPLRAGAADRIQVDRTAVRFVTAETGGSVRPRFLSERELAFFARAEAQMEGAALAPDEYPERFVRSVTERLVARAMLASLLLQRGSEPPDLPKLVADLRAGWEDRLGGATVLTALLEREKIDASELAAFLAMQVRANWYIDTAIAPILTVTEDALRETYRGATHPFKNLSYDDAKPRLKRWLVGERARVSELEFLQGTRGRVKITVVERSEK